MPISLSGMDELLARLARTTQNVSAVKKKALKAGAEKIRKPIADLAPRSSIPHEHMADSIVISEMQTDSSGNVFVEVGPKKSKFYAKFQEFGTVKQKAQPFEEPGYLQGRKGALSTIADVIRGAIESG